MIASPSQSGNEPVSFPNDHFSADRTAFKDQSELQERGLDSPYKLDVDLRTPEALAMTGRAYATERAGTFQKNLIEISKTREGKKQKPAPKSARERKSADPLVFHVSGNRHAFFPFVMAYFAGGDTLHLSDQAAGILKSQLDKCLGKSDLRDRAVAEAQKHEMSFSTASELLNTTFGELLFGMQPTEIAALKANAGVRETAKAQNVSLTVKGVRRKLANSDPDKSNLLSGDLSFIYEPINLAKNKIAADPAAPAPAIASIIAETHNQTTLPVPSVLEPKTTSRMIDSDEARDMYLLSQPGNMAERLLRNHANQTFGTLPKHISTLIATKWPEYHYKQNTPVIMIVRDLSGKGL